MALEKFMSTYEKEYKNLKVSLLITSPHTNKARKQHINVNMSATVKTSFLVIRLKNCARACLKPFMMQRKVNNDLISKCEVNLL